MAYILPPEAEIIERIYYDDIYGIEPGRVHCHAFSIPPLSSVELTIIHTAINSQDLSIRYWFSLEPLGDSMFYDLYNRGFYPAMRDEGQIWKISDEVLISNSYSHTFTGPVNKPIWLNVQNMQNSQNGYQLIFEVDNCI